jgi:hypothetical protein
MREIKSTRKIVEKICERIEHKIWEETLQRKSASNRLLTLLSTGVRKNPPMEPTPILTRGFFPMKGFWYDRSYNCTHTINHTRSQNILQKMVEF